MRALETNVRPEVLEGRTLFEFLYASILASIGIEPIHAQPNFPTRTTRVIVNFATGGPSGMVVSRKIESEMPPLHAAILIVWTDIPREVEAAFNDWYNHEHLPDRVGRMPGFVRGRRYVAEPLVAGTPKYLTLYDLTHAELMMSPAHVALRKQRPPRDLQFVPLFRNTIKGICDVAGRVGESDGGDHLVMLPVRALPDDFAARVANELLPRIAALPGVNRATMAMRNAVVTAASSAKDDRAGDRYVDGLIVVELSDANAASAVVAAMGPEQIASLGGATQYVPEPAVLRLIYELQADHC